eukprot:scaffold90634_cov33-Tisochrysis_lutea.AAC.2
MPARGSRPKPMVIRWHRISCADVQSVTTSQWLPHGELESPTTTITTRARGRMRERSGGRHDGSQLPVSAPASENIGNVIPSIVRGRF